MSRTKKVPDRLDSLVTEGERKRLARYRLHLEDNCRAFKIGPCRVLMAHVAQAGHYMAISCGSRYPTWKEVLQIRDLFFPGPTRMGAIARGPGERIGSPPHTLELWELSRPTSSTVYDRRGRPLGIERRTDSERRLS